LMPLAVCWKDKILDELWTNPNWGVWFRDPGSIEEFKQWIEDN